jgi:hypothetical protein
MKSNSYLNYRMLTALPALAALALTGCETVVDLPEPPHTPRIALQYMLSNTLPTPPNNPNSNFDLFLSRRLYVSSSQRIFDTRRLEGRDDATVELRDDQGQVVEQFVSSGQQYYGSGFYDGSRGLRGQPGKTYTLHAELPGFEPVESTLTLPTLPVIESATFVPRTGNNGQTNQSAGRLSVTVADDPATTDYYLAFARILDRQGNPGAWSQVQIDYGNQNTDLDLSKFQLSNPGIYGGYDTYPYPDTNVNGQRFALNTDVVFYQQVYCGPNQPTCPEIGYMEVFVSKITKDTYDFYQSRRRYMDTDGNPFAEPAPLSSNIKPGYGLFGGSTDATVRIKLF